MQPSHKGQSSTALRLRHAEGYLDLKMVEEARAELASIPTDDWSHRDVIEARIRLHQAAKEWELMAGFSQQLAVQHPETEWGWIHWAYALRELQLIVRARDVLLEARDRHGHSSPNLHLNLGCYFCLLGEIEAAREHVARACRLDGAFRAVALEDPDLSILWQCE